MEILFQILGKKPITQSIYCNDGEEGTKEAHNPLWSVETDNRT